MYSLIFSFDYRVIGMVYTIPYFEFLIGINLILLFMHIYYENTDIVY